MTKIAAREPRMVYLERLIFMAALTVLAEVMQGMRAAVVSVLSVLLCMITDAICCKIRKIKYDPRAAEVPFWGLAAAMMMPASVPFSLVVQSAVICIVVGKHLFGASDNIVFSPPAISTAFLMICYPAEMLYFPRYGDECPVFGDFNGTLVRSAEYSLKMGIAPSGSISDILMGSVAGAVGSTYVLVLLVCGICLVVRRSNSLCMAASCLISAGLMALLFPRINTNGWSSVFYELTSGYLLFGTVFLAAEPYRIPQRTMGKVLYGAVLGLVTITFRYFGQTEGSFLFALLITCAVCDSFDRIVENLAYWKKTYVNSFEKSKSQIQKGGGPKLSDTQEIMLPEKYRYNTPPIDGKVKRHRRRQGDNASKENRDDKK